MDFVVRSGFYLFVAACIFQVRRGGAKEAYTVHIQRQPNAIDVNDSNITLSCVVSGNTENINIKWIVNSKEAINAQCDAGNDTTDSPKKVCTLTTQRMEETTVYRCEAYGNDGHTVTSNNLTIRGCGSKCAATIAILDGSTGKLVDADPTCVLAGATHSFECLVQDKNLHPAPWNISWIIKNVTHTNNASATTFHGEYVNVRRRFNVTNLGNNSRFVNLTCHATSHGGQSLNATVKIQFCYVPSGIAVNVVVAVVSVLATLMTVGALLCAIKLRRATQTQQAGIQHVDVTASEPPPQVALISRKTETTRNQPYQDIPPDTGQEYEHRITADALHQYEGRITEEDLGSTGAEDGGDLPSWAERWQIPWRDLEVYDRVLGTGEFGEVRLGAVKVDGEIKKSAVKMLKGHASPIERDDFLAELQTMTSIGSHPHIVSLIGACQHQDVLYVALEYLSNGDLRSFLRTARTQSDTDEGTLSRQQLLTFALDVAKGMDYLAAKGVIHRDLAARNILLGDGLVAKVSDFGLSRGEDLYVQTSNKRVPIRWLAIESMAFQTYTTQSDVWSFGILLWEITTIGGTPYPSIKSETLESKLSRGYRMPKPNNCDDKTYALMRRCWKEESKKRPTFDELVSILSEMTDTRIKHTYMSTYRVQYENLSAIRPELDDN